MTDGLLVAKEKRQELRMTPPSLQIPEEDGQRGEGRAAVGRQWVSLDYGEDSRQKSELALQRGILAESCLWGHLYMDGSQAADVSSGYGRQRGAQRDTAAQRAG